MSVAKRHQMRAQFKSMKKSLSPRRISLRKFFALFLNAGVICLLSAAPSSALAAMVEIAIENHSFEDVAVPDGYYTVNTIPGWKGEGSWHIIANPTDAIFTGTTDGGSGPNPIDGKNTAAVNNYGHILYQTLTVQIQPNFTYTLSALVGHRIGVPIDDVSVNLKSGDFFMGRAFAQPAEGTFDTVSTVYHSPASGGLVGHTFEIELRSAGTIAQGWFDNVHLYAEESASGTVPTTLSNYIPIPPNESTYTPGAWPGFTPFGGGGTLDPAPVPEPSTFLAGALMLVPFIGILRRRFFKDSTGANRR